MKYKTYSIQCGPYTFQVRWMESGDLDHDKGKNAGTVDYTTRTVRLARDTDKLRLLDTKIHEYIHVVEMVYGLELSEHQVLLLGLGLAQILAGRVDVEKI